MHDTLAVILGGGRGTRLDPLTQYRSKPAVPIAGKYRLVDIPVSNCLNSQLRRIYVLTQHNSESLNKHVSLTYNFDIFSSGFVSLLAAEQTAESPEWFQGTADAVRQSMRHLDNHRWNQIVILSGDQLYQMDLQEALRQHRDSKADVTVAVKPVPPQQASAFGILKLENDRRIGHFEEKPGPERVGELVSDVPGLGQACYASMGIYVFSRQALKQALEDRTLVDFGHHVIPWAVSTMHVQGYIHDGYWEDVGTIQSYYDANLELCEAVPPFDFYEATRPVYTRPRFLPASKVESCTLRSALVSEGCILMGAEIERSVVGIRSRIGKGAQITDSLLLGADDYETIDEILRASEKGRPPIGIGDDCVIHGAIIDKNARIGRGVQIVNETGARNADGPGYAIRDGIVVVVKNAVIHDGTVI
jgi:glucose-1-phosphate adenylyltransferase